MGSYRVAQICLNGHCITDSCDVYPELRQPFCSKCGSKTITTCPKCSANIRGHYYVEGFFVPSNYHTPSYCYNCGEAFPWTKAALDATAAIILEEDSLSELQQSNLVEVLPDVIVETPKTSLASTRIKKVLSSAGQFTSDAIRQFVIDFGCEFIKKQLGI